MLVNEGFSAKRTKSERLPPGQYEERDFPVLSIGPTPRVDQADWSLEVGGLVKSPLHVSWQELLSLPRTEWVRDIHCVTKWSKFDTKWDGVILDELIRRADVSEQASHAIFHSSDGYTTNLPLEDVIEGKAIIAISYEGGPIPSEHGGPVRMVIPHLYFWKSAKWLTKIELVGQDEPGFWETRGYHNYGDPWREQRYSFD